MQILKISEQPQMLAMPIMRSSLEAIKSHSGDVIPLWSEMHQLQITNMRRGPHGIQATSVAVLAVKRHEGAL